MRETKEEPLAAARVEEAKGEGGKAEGGESKAVLSPTDRKSIYTRTFLFAAEVYRHLTTKTLHPRYLITYSDTYIFFCSYTVPIRLCGADIY